ncbi:SDR family oxidoreductase [Nesterenkonia sp. MY13]|uniref:SDR family oxidoreductase n=1 Tax=Nesterenkonia sedimenti TaxID=1463632 RepID=A0A7X8YDV0_9MICC|nr:SDR family oxidoreductase [Nesterenkonia sedimenti]NLS09924.1 SDR family oxidoreductase [Nesterenkonia sedimenti]
MAEQNKVVIVGGHGKIALLAAPKLIEAGFEVESLFRNPEHTDEVAATGAKATVLDIENADTATLAETFAGAAAVVFSAGAGGGNPARTKAVDHEAAIRTMDAAAQAGISRYVMVSYARSETDIHTLDPENSFYPYAAAKHHADNYLRGTELDYTILGPGKLTLEPASGKLTTSPTETFETSRENVAEVIRYVLAEDAAIGETVNFFDGDTPIAEIFG